MVLGSHLAPPAGFGVQQGGDGGRRRAEAAGAALIAGDLHHDSKAAPAGVGAGPGETCEGCPGLGRIRP